MRKFYCANCGKELIRDVYMCLDNYIQVKYFDDNKTNRFCDAYCFAEFLSCESVDLDDVPLDDGEKEEPDEEEEIDDDFSELDY